MLLLHMTSQSRSICANFPAHLTNKNATSTLVSRSRVQPLLLLPFELSTTGCHTTNPHLLLLVLRLPEHPVQIFLVTRRAVLWLELFTTDFAWEQISSVCSLMLLESHMRAELFAANLCLLLLKLCKVLWRSLYFRPDRWNDIQVHELSCAPPGCCWFWIS